MTPNEQAEYDEMENAARWLALTPGLSLNVFNVVAAIEGAHTFTPEFWDQWDVVFMINCLNSWSREYGKAMMQQIVDTGTPLIVTIPKVLHAGDPAESLWVWTDLAPYGIVKDASTWCWLIYRLGA